VETAFGFCRQIIGSDIPPEATRQTAHSTTRSAVASSNRLEYNQGPMPGSLPEHFVLFADILGFSTLTETSPQSVITPPMFFATDHSGWVSDSMTIDTRPASWAFYHFHEFLERWLQTQARRGGPGLTVLSFSDSAFVILEDAGTIASLARHMMRACLHRKVPVRMGISRGTFQQVRFRSDTARQVLIYGAQFYGTGIVRAHHAEHQGGKGMRVFLHPSMRDHLGPMTRGGYSKILDLEAPTDAAHWELEYFTDHGGKPWSDQKPDEAECLELWKNVKSMQQAALEMPEPIRDTVQKQYLETLAAFDRMRDALGLSRFENTTTDSTP
jgi:hypothetical protein